MFALQAVVKNFMIRKIINSQSIETFFQNLTMSRCESVIIDVHGGM